MAYDLANLVCIALYSGRGANKGSKCAGIQDMLSRVCKQKKINEEEFFGGLKKKGQWHVEVY